MSLFPTYVYEEGTELPEEGNYFVVAANGMFMHKDISFVKALVKFDLDSIPMMRDFVPPKPDSLPVYVYNDDCGELPSDGDYYLVAKNGIFLHKGSPKADEFKKSSLENIPNLGSLRTKVRFDLPTIPVEIIGRALLFFRRVWHTHRSEAALVLFYNAKDKEYFLHCPKQNVSGSSVRYGLGEDEETFISEMRQKGYGRVGTIHSHCNFSAFHSGTDTDDEAHWPDGVHITIGHVDAKRFSVAASLVVNNNRFQTEPTKIIDGLSGGSSKKIGFGRDAFYSLALSKTEKEALVNSCCDEIQNEWLPKVNTTTWTAPKKWQNPAVVGSPGIVIQGEPPADVSLKESKCVEFLKLVRDSALELLEVPAIPKDREAMLLEPIQRFLCKDVISREDISTVTQINPENYDFYATKGLNVHEKVES